MKAIIISSLLFFSLRAMSAETAVGEYKGAEAGCEKLKGAEPRAAKPLIEDTREIEEGAAAKSEAISV